MKYGWISLSLSQMINIEHWTQNLFNYGHGSLTSNTLGCEKIFLLIAKQGVNTEKINKLTSCLFHIHSLQNVLQKPCIFSLVPESLSYPMFSFVVWFCGLLCLKKKKSTKYAVCTGVPKLMRTTVDWEAPHMERKGENITMESSFPQFNYHQS